MLNTVPINPVLLNVGDTILVPYRKIDAIVTITCKGIINTCLPRVSFIKGISIVKGRRTLFYQEFDKRTTLNKIINAT